MGSRAIVLGGLTTLILLAFGAGVGLAADYQDEKGNVCEGNFAAGWCKWGSHVTGPNNVAVGPEMMPSLTSGEDNVALGLQALNHDTSGGNNIALGDDALYSNTEGSENFASGRNALESNKIGSENIAIGRSALERNTSGGDNIASGSSALLNNTTGFNNIASGFDALESNTEGSYNVASGYVALSANTTGSENVALGYGAGEKLTTGSNNIDISSPGVAADKGTARIGAEGTQTRAFIAGIFPTHVVGCTVQVTSPEGQLGCNPLAAVEGKEGKEGKEGAPGKEGKEGKPGPAGPEGKEGKEGKAGTGTAGNAAIATFASFENVANGHCLNYTEVGDPGNAPCPGKTTGFSAGRLLAGPTPAGGATVSNLYADSNATVSGKDTVLVAVIDNTTGATLLSCTVNSTTKKSCSNTSGSGPVAAGDNIEVKLTATGPSGNNKQWRVRFRY
jgi:hypothetical protein